MWNGYDPSGVEISTWHLLFWLERCEGMLGRLWLMFDAVLVGQLGQLGGGRQDRRVAGPGMECR